MDTEASVSINDERTDQNHISEEISSHENSTEIFDHACGDSGINLVNTEEEVDITCINSSNETNAISKNDDGIFS